MGVEAIQPIVKERPKLKIDDVVDVYQEVWTRASMLPIPLLSDSEEIIEEQNHALLGVMNLFQEQFPEMFQAWLSVESLINELDMVKDEDDYDETVARIEPQIETIRTEFPETETIDFVRGGIESLISKREEIRLFQKICGEPDPASGLLLDLDLVNSRAGNFGLLPEISGHITRVLVGAYSINIFVDGNTYKKIKSYNDEFETGGVHLGDTVINLIRDISTEPLDPSKNAYEEILLRQKRLHEVVLHEEFHGFASAFEHGNPTFSYEKRKIEDTVREMKAHFNGDKYNFVGSFAAFTGLDFSYLIDSSAEEILAEMAMNPSRKFIPSSSFYAFDDLKKRFIGELVSDPDLSSRDVKIKNAVTVDIPKLRQDIEFIYDMVDEYAPHLKERVDILFAIIPPSKVRFIKKVVMRWIQAESDEDYIVNSSNSSSPFSSFELL